MIERVPLRTPTLPPATHTNTYLLGVSVLAVVDPATPYPKEQRKLEALLDARIEAGARVDRIVLTHHHLDHVGHVRRLRKRLGVPVVAHWRTRDLLAPAIVVDELLDEGDVVTVDDGEWQVFHTPGHATGHLCFLDDHGELVAGDMVAGVGTIVLDPPQGDLADYLHSLERLKELRPQRIHPAHGPAIDDPVRLLQEYIDHRNMRTDQVRVALAGLGSAKPRHLVPIVYPDLHPFARPIAARQMLCHLQWLVAHGEVYNLNGRFSMAGPA